MGKFTYIKALFSPFKSFKLKWYSGKIAIGTPIFFPRRWVKNPDKPGYLKAIPRKFGFDFVGLGWKTKWSKTDYRFEWSPVISFVFFKWQIAVIVVAPYLDHYWESWLYYYYNTNKTLSKRDRIEQCKKEFPQNWIGIKDGVEEKIDYYNLILKEKYI